MARNNQNPNLISDRDIRISKWWLEHKLLIRKIGKTSLIVLTALIWLIFIIYVVTYFLHYQQNQEILKQLGQQTLTGNAVLKPVALTPGTVYVFEPDTANYDFLVQVENTNTKYTATSFKYHFELNGKSTPSQSSWLLPGEKKYLVSLDFSAGVIDLTQGRFIVDEVTWQRLEDIENFPETDFVVQDLKFSNITLSQGAEVGSELTGKVYNAGIYGFKEAEVIVILFNNNIPLAIGSTQLNNFTTEAIKPLQFTWKDKFPFSALPQAFVETNILNPENFILP